MDCLPNRSALSPASRRGRTMVRVRDILREVGAEYVAVMVMDLEEDGASLPFLALEHIILRIRSLAGQRGGLTGLVDVIATFMLLVHEPDGIDIRSSSGVVSVVRDDILTLVNQIIVYSSPETVAAAARETMAVIILAVIDDDVLAQLF